MILTHKYRLLPSKGQHRRLCAALDHTRDLYNAALQERIDCYRKTGISRTRYDQQRSLTELRIDPEWRVYSATMQRWPLVQVDFAFSEFFRRIKSGEKPGFPRFKGRQWFKSFGFNDRNGWRVRNGSLIMKGIGAIRLHLYRPLPSEPIACKVKREGRHWYALLSREILCAETHKGPAVGVDVGLVSLAALSTGETIPNPRAYARAQKELRRRQRALARCKRGSKGRRKARERVSAAHGKTRRTRKTYLHQVSADLTKRFSLIAIEKLNMKGLSNGMLAKSVHDASWGKLRQMLTYKAERAGCQLIEVDPNYTSQTCPDCGNVKKKELSERVHSCDCGCVLDRDVAAARVILDRGVVLAGQLNVAGCGERAGGKLVQSKIELRHYRDEEQAADTLAILTGRA